MGRVGGKRVGLDASGIVGISFHDEIFDEGSCVVVRTFQYGMKCWSEMIDIFVGWSNNSVRWRR